MPINIVLVSWSPTLAPDARAGLRDRTELGNHRNASANEDFIAARGVA